MTIKIQDGAFENFLQTIRNASSSALSKVLTGRTIRHTVKRWRELESRGHGWQGVRDALLIDFDIPIGRNRKILTFLIPRLGDQFSEGKFSLPRPNLKVEFKDFDGATIISDNFIPRAPWLYPNTGSGEESSYFIPTQNLEKNFQ